MRCSCSKELLTGTSDVSHRHQKPTMTYSRSGRKLSEIKNIDIMGTVVRVTWEVVKAMFRAVVGLVGFIIMLALVFTGLTPD